MSAPSDYFPALSLLHQFLANIRFQVKNPALLQHLLCVESKALASKAGGASKAADRRVWIDFSGSLRCTQLIDSLFFIVKVAGPSQLHAFFIPSGLAQGEISNNPEKNPCWLSV
ncbi:hypothetical protein [Paenibacillus eucommiae]|uniref:Uncharacterized protein n=1 Tax=Paenibacillus eucommiae TaxID=1355755 RepID=A0ABS4IU37_9BACL|nr:hypothetical protein [Paenibacillus eucommiae]MBP1991068.1 hypothetical protein [Paenibacillus eucommiae]